MVWSQKPVDSSLWAQKNQTKLPSVWAEKIGGGNRIVFGGGVVDSVGTRVDPSATRDDSGGTKRESGRFWQKRLWRHQNRLWWFSQAKKSGKKMIFTIIFFQPV